MGSWSDLSPGRTRQLRGDPAHLLFQPDNQNHSVSDPTSLRFCWSRHWAAASVQWAWCRHSAGELVGAAFFLQGSIKRGIITLMDLHVYLSHISLLLRSALLWLRVIKLRSELWKYWIYSGAAALRSTAPRGDILYVVFSAFILQQRANFTERPVWSTDSGSGVAVVQFGPVYVEMAAYTTSHSLHSLSSARSTLHINVPSVRMNIHARRSDTNILQLLCSRPVPHRPTWRPRPAVNISPGSGRQRM